MSVCLPVQSVYVFNALSVKNFCVVAVRVKNYLARNKVIARSEAEKCLVLQGAWNTWDILNIQCGWPSGGIFYFPPQTGPGIFGSAAESVSLGGMLFVPNIIKTGLKSIYMACSCSQHTTSGCTTTWQEACKMPWGIQLCIKHHHQHEPQRAAGCATVVNHQDPCALPK